MIADWNRARMSYGCSDQELSPRCWLGKVPAQPALNLNENIIEYRGMLGGGCCKTPWKAAASFYLQSDGLTPGEKHSMTNTRLRASHLPPESSNHYCLLPANTCESMGFFALVSVQLKSTCLHAGVVLSCFPQLKPLLLPFQLVDIVAASHVSTSIDQAVAAWL